VSDSDRLAEIRRMQGLPAMPDPGIIDAAPNLLSVAPELPDPDDLERDAFDLLPDPLPDESEATIYPEPGSGPVPWPEPPSEAPSGLQAMAEWINAHELVVTDISALYRQRPVTLNEVERGKVVAVVLGAMRRTLDEQFAELGLTRKRVRKKKVAESALGNDAGPGDSRGPSAPPPKKRGRPRKVREHLDGSVT